MRRPRAPFLDFSVGVNRLFVLQAGPDYIRRRGYGVMLILIPRFDLTYEGERILCALAVEILFYGDRRPRVLRWSNPREILRRNAEGLADA